MIHGVLPYVLATILLGVGIYAITCKKNVIKIIIGVIVTEYAVNMFLILIGYRSGGIAPVLTRAMDKSEFINQSVDPIPQALILTSIVIGLGIVALMVAIAIRLYEKYGTFDISEIRKLRG